MKIALLYSGTIRHLANTMLNNLFAFNYFDEPIDLYFSVWDHMGYVDHINAPDYMPYPKTLPADTKVDDQLIKDIVSYALYFSKIKVNIKAIKIDIYDPNKYHLDLINGVNNIGLYAQYYKILDCFNLLDNTNYDMLVRCRCDILLNLYDTEYFKNTIKNDKIIFPTKIWYNHTYKSDSDGINEMIWVANKPLMKKACNIYANADKINNIIKTKNQNTANYGESICLMNLEAEGIRENIQTFDFDYNVLR